MKWAGMFVWTIQIAPRKPVWFQTNSNCQQGVGTFPEKKQIATGKPKCTEQQTNNKSKLLPAE
jgi:hypothetical protein